MTNLRFAMIGAGFWAPYQLAAWSEVDGAQCVALCDVDRARAESVAQQAGVERVYTDMGELLEREQPDFVDIVTSPETHGPLARLAASKGVPAICQKPMTPTLQEAEALVDFCKQRHVPFFVHENWRWQTPIRALKHVLETGVVGTPFRARIQFASSFPVFENQPFLKNLEQFILTDMGAHILDVARFLFGEAESVYCRTARVHEDIAGEDVATVLLALANGCTVICELSYASRTAYERFPETFIYVEAERGSVDLLADYQVRTVTAEGVQVQRHPPPVYRWADPDYALVQAAMVPCSRNLLAALRGDAPGETTGADNLQTLRLVFAAYESAASGQAVPVS